MRVSLNELDTMVKRAARGAGCPWGMAEEAGKAARWLSARGEPGVAVLGEVLKASDASCCCACPVVLKHAQWVMEGRDFCSLRAGAMLADRAAELAGGAELTFGPVNQPLLLAAFAAAAAKITGKSVELSWRGARVVATGAALFVEGNDLNVGRTEAVTCRVTSQALAPRALLAGCDVEDADWQRLAVLAQRSYAPATEESRLAGAGAGDNDND
ncbi:MAG: DUF3726 domain-containing protein [Rhodospirillaceae bacterium]|jgi:hypothetical protein|nr:DUF3726 domain-containing protein [Rhodospirillaceae bacterium]MBT6205366.1 DUF3726 domain-containing protein [Rhodospirillaceae bacterium]MBT6512107.1 DUF3726 domain-containing protein [Rhodospirillaceae bacterium]